MASLQLKNTRGHFYIGLNAGWPLMAAPNNGCTSIWKREIGRNVFYDTVVFFSDLSYLCLAYTCLSRSADYQKCPPNLQKLIRSFCDMISDSYISVLIRSFLNHTFHYSFIPLPIWSESGPKVRKRISISTIPFILSFCYMILDMNLSFISFLFPI